MTKFTNGESQILVASDLLNRGIDIPNINAVINYDLPKDAQTYLHRIGRSGRFGLKSTAITLVGGDEIPALHNLESTLKTNIYPFPKN